jgi:hypothetical protein
MKQKLGITPRVEKVGETIFIMIIGLLIFKYLPMFIFGSNILFDASLHVIFISLVLYVLYLTVEDHKQLRMAYLLFSIVVLVGIGIQRYVAFKHDLFGIIMGLVISYIAIMLPLRRKRKIVKKKNLRNVGKRKKGVWGKRK